MKLIVGLGNPGKKYEKTWHNLGFMAVDKIAKDLKTEFKEEKKFSAALAVVKFKNEKIILLKPQTFMNNSGVAILAIMNFYKIGVEDLIVIHDDIDLPLGKLRIVKDSSAGGNNGIKSIIELLKSKNFIRIKIGVATSDLKIIGSADYVLEKIKAENIKKANEEIAYAADAAICLIEKSTQEAMNLYN